MATKKGNVNVEPMDDEEMEMMAGPDPAEVKVKLNTPRPRPGEETEIFISDGRRNVLVKLGMEVEVPMWVAERYWNMEKAEMLAYKYEMDTEKQAEKF